MPDLQWWTLYGLCVPILLWVVKKYPLTAGVPRRRYAYYASAVFVASAAHITLMVVLLPPQFNSAIAAVFNNLPFDVFFGCVIVSILLGAQYHKTVYQESVAAANLEMSVARAEMEALSTQVRPEVLFTTLNAIAALTLENPARVERCIVMFSEFLRSALQSGQLPNMPLERDLDLLEQYAAIVNEVSCGRCSVAIDVSADARQSLVPPFLCQEIVHRLIVRALATQSTRRVALSVRRRIDALSLRFESGEDGGSAVDIVIGKSRNDVVAQRLVQLYGGTASIALNPRGATVVTIPFHPALVVSKVDERPSRPIPFARDPVLDEARTN